MPSRPQSNRVKLTQKRVGLAIREAMRTKREVVAWCVEPSGFGCRARPTGRAAYIFQFRSAGDEGGRTQKITIGASTAFTVDEARTLARGYAQALALGRDPREDAPRRRAKPRARAVEAPTASAAAAPTEPDQPPTLRALFDRFERQNASRLSMKTLEGMRSHLRSHLAPLAERSIDAIKRADVADLHAGAVETPYAANRALATLSTLFSFAEAMEIAPPGANPAKGVRRHREAHRERLMSGRELSALWRALIALEATPRHRFAAAALRLGALTGWRVGEVRTLEWADVDLVAREAIIHGKTGARRAPLPPPATGLLAAVGAASRHFGEGEHRGRYVFPSTAGATAEAGALTDWEHRRTWEKACAAAALSDLRRHDLRHLVAGVIGAQTGSALRVKEAMGHRSLAVSERYVSPISELQRQTTDAAATAIISIAEGDEPRSDALRHAG